MSEHTFQFPVLNPWEPLPKDFAFCESVTDGVARLIGGSISAAIWRPPNVDEIIAASARASFPLARASKKTEITVSSDELYDQAPEVECLIKQVCDDLYRHYDMENYGLRRWFNYYFEGAADIVHTDAFLDKESSVPVVHALLTLKGTAGTWVLSPRELKESGRWEIWFDKSEVNELPQDLFYQVAVGDVIMWRRDFPHAAPYVDRPEDERLIGAVYPRKIHRDPV